MNQLFKDYLHQVNRSQLDLILSYTGESAGYKSTAPLLNREAKELIGEQYYIRDRSANIMSHPVHVWVEVGEEWIHYTVSFQKAKQMALGNELECRYCWAIIRNVAAYARNRGYCEGCQQRCRESGGTVE